jgi:YesN/AraC family two-component response regulator
MHNISLVLLDLTMPKMSGTEAFDKIRHLSSDIRIIISSGYHEQEVTKTFAGRNISGFIQKPYNLATLSSKLKAILADI